MRISINFGILIFNFTQMEIFNKQIFGDCIEEFCHLSTLAKVNWIKNNTNQSDDVIIYNWLANYKNQKKSNCCLNCSKNGNISKTVSIEVKPVTKSVEVKGNSDDNSTKRPRKTKGA
jgi:hypothetical protein